MSHRPTDADHELAAALRQPVAQPNAAGDLDVALSKALRASFKSAEPNDQPPQVTGLYVYTAIPDRWCFKCQRERPALYCVICRAPTKRIVELDPREIKPRTRLGRIWDRFKLARANRRR